jgi:7-cyano-7-deazaguanine synthase in queuosine biosynthesis
MILLFSGGLDSYIAWHYLNKPKTLYIDLGHRYAAHELEMVNKLIPSTIIDTRLNLADWEEKDANIPLRNAFLVMIASKYDDDVVLVVQKGEMNIPDRSMRFFNYYGDWLSYLWGDGRTVTFSTPFFNMTKTDMVRWYISAGLDTEKLISTRSCYSPGDLPCGNCAACFRRWVAFTNNNLGEENEQDIKKYS